MVVGVICPVVVVVFAVGVSSFLVLVAVVVILDALVWHGHLRCYRVVVVVVAVVIVVLLVVLVIVSLVSSCVSFVRCGLR